MIDILSSGRARARMPRSLIIEPTRELAAQVADNFDNYGRYTRLTKALLIGGESMADQLKVLERGADVLIATPGRLLDVFDRGKLLLSDIKVLVIDEADRMLDMGFIPDIERICKLLPTRRQTLFFSATMPAEIQRLVNSFLNDPVRIEVTRPASVVATITQRFRYCPSAEDYRPIGGEDQMPQGRYLPGVSHGFASRSRWKLSLAKRLWVSLASVSAFRRYLGSRLFRESSAHAS
jgi:superfamily II DNA/RNA helicase